MIRGMNNSRISRTVCSRLSGEEQEKVSGLEEQGKIKLGAKTAKCMKEIAEELTEERVLEKLCGTKVKKDAGSRTIKLSASYPYHRHGKSKNLRQAIRSIKGHDVFQMNRRKYV